MKTEAWNQAIICYSDHCFIEEAKRSIRIKRHLFWIPSIWKTQYHRHKASDSFCVKNRRKTFPLKICCTFQIRPLQAGLEYAVLSVITWECYLEFCFRIWIIIFFRNMHNWYNRDCIAQCEFLIYTLNIFGGKRANIKWLWLGSSRNIS